MSYDLFFWTQKPDSVDTPNDVCNALTDGVSSDAVQSIDETAIMDDIRAAFPSAQPDRYSFSTDYGSVDFYVTEQYASFMIYGHLGEFVDQIVELMERHRCCLYDPQLDTRYDLGAVPQTPNPTAERLAEWALPLESRDPFAKERQRILLIFGAIVVVFAYLLFGMR